MLQGGRAQKANCRLPNEMDLSIINTVTIYHGRV